MKGMKNDQEKLRMDLIPPRTLMGLGRVLTYGANKYEANNWQGVEIDRYVAALLRHYMLWKNGEKDDQESGLPHTEHMLANAAFIHWLDNQ